MMTCRELVIVTFNIYMSGYENEEGAAKTIAAIVESAADVVCLQECNAHWQRIMEPEVSDTYPHTYFFNDVSIWGGRAVLSKYPITSTDFLDRVFPWWYGALFINLDVDGEEMSLLNVHLRAPFPSNPFKVQSQRRLEIETHMKKLDSKKNLIVLGDFNTPSGPCHCHMTEVEGFRNALEETGNACYAKSWHIYGLVGLLYDHIYYNPAAYQLVNAEVRKVGGSDHWPLFATLKGINDDIVHD